MLRHNCQNSGEITVNLLAYRKRLNVISWSLNIQPKCDQRNLEADVTSCANGVTEIDFLCENIALVLNKNINRTVLHSFR